MRKKCSLIVLLCLIFLIVSGCDNGNTTANEELAQSMTLMIYMVGSDLESATAAATNDMKEIEASGVDLSKVKVLVYTGGTQKWHNDSLEIPTDAHTVFELSENGFEQAASFEAISMGDPISLSRFLQYGYENYQSETYGVILWDHGNGPVMGYGSDIQYGQDALTLPEIETALADSPFNAENKLEFIGFDACLMASAELACIVDDYSDYLVASQEVEPGFGWNYAFLEQCGKVDITTLLQGIVDKYITYSEAYFEQNTFFKSEVTLAVMDLSYADDLENAIDSLFGEAAADVSEVFNELALERVETRSFGRATTGSEYDLVDIQALMESMSDTYNKQTKTVQDVLDQMVVYNDSNTVQSCGLSLYYPYYNKKYYEASWKDSYAKLGLFPNYLSYLEGYEEIWLGTDMKEYFSGRLVASDSGSGTYTLQLSEEQNERFADAGFYILRQMSEDSYSLVYYSQNVTNEEGLLTAKFDGKVLYYGDDLGFKSIPVARVLDEVDGETRYAIFPTLTGASADFLETEDMMCRLVVSVDPETSEVTVLDFSENTNQEIQTGKRPQVNLDDWVRIQFYEISSRYLTRDEEGYIKQYWEWPQGDWIIWNEMALADGLQFTYEPLYDDGKSYYLMFNVMDVQGNQYSSELYPITLEEAPPTEEVLPTDAGTLEGSSALIFERDNVRLYLDLVEDSALRQTSYCFRAENNNDFPVRIQIQDMIVNEDISCTDTSIFMTIEANSTDYDFAKELSSVCMLEQMDYLEQLEFSVRMNSEENDKTLINDEFFMLRIGKSAESRKCFLPYMGACAEEQVLTEEKDSICVTMIGAGYELNCNNYFPDSEYARFTEILRIENTSEVTQHVCIEGIDINDISRNTDENYSEYPREMTLEPGQVYYYIWDISSSEFAEKGISEITSLANRLTFTSDEGTNSKTFHLILEED